MVQKFASLFIVGFVLFCQLTPSIGDELGELGKTSTSEDSGHPPAPYEIHPAFSHVSFKKPSSIEEIPGANRLLITELGGKIWSVAKDAGVRKADLVLDLTKSSGGSATVFDAEFHPRFQRNRNVFVCYVHPGAGGHVRVSRFMIPHGSPPKVKPGSEQVIISYPPGAHNGGCLEFGKDGYLYISTGDGAKAKTPDSENTGQDVSDLLSSVLRIDIDRAEAGQAYSVPADNPFVDLDGARPEVWALGLRNPWKIGIDPVTGNVFAADNGLDSWEMVYHVVRGGNYGWPVMEGRASLRKDVKLGPTPIIPPTKDHPHSEANSVIGGPVYRGSAFPELASSFIYGDFVKGTIWALRANVDGTWSHRTLADTDLQIISLTEGSHGELYVLDHGHTGQIYELAPRSFP